MLDEHSLKTPQLLLNFRGGKEGGEGVLKEILVTTFNDTCELTFTKFVTEKDIDIRNRSETFRLPWSHSSVFVLEKMSQK